MTVSIEASRRERKKSATRAAIHDAAASLTLERGLANVTVESIATRADVATRTFFNYFASKEEAVVGRDPARAEGLRSALLDRPAGEDVLTALRTVLEADIVDRIGDIENARRRWALVMEEPTLRATVAAEFDQIEDALVEGVAVWTGRDAERDLYPGLVVSAACGAARVAAKRWMKCDGRRSLHKLMLDAFDLLADGLAALPRRPL